MFEKINVWLIIKDHFATLYRRENPDRVCWQDIVTFFLMPIILSIICILFFKSVFNNPDTYNLIATIVSIFGGLLLNLLLLIFDILEKMKEDTPKREKKKKLLMEINANISYSILLSVIIIVTLLINHAEFSCLLRDFLLWLLAFLLFHFLTTLLMVLKRVFILLKHEF